MSLMSFFDVVVCSLIMRVPSVILLSLLVVTNAYSWNPQSPSLPLPSISVSGGPYVSGSYEGHARVTLTFSRTGECGPTRHPFTGAIIGYPNCQIYYNFTGNPRTNIAGSATRYTSAITVNNSATIYARVVKKPSNSNFPHASDLHGSVRSRYMPIVKNVARPQLSELEGEYHEPITVTASTSTLDARLRFTLDGSDPIEEIINGVVDPVISSPLLPSGGVPINQSAVLKVRGFKDTLDPSATDTGQFAIFNPDSDLFDVDGAGDADGAGITTSNRPAMTPDHPNDVVGAIPGDFSVGMSGSAEYRIPIEIPPGTGGVQPDLSLHYSSQGRSGNMGLGWMIDGMSLIHRCPANIAKDGYTDGVEFDANDRVCLDGQPLIAVDVQGNRLSAADAAVMYGQDGTHYRTEIDSFARITSKTSAVTGRIYFEVKTKAGEIMEYGNTEDSYINPPLPGDSSGAVDTEALCWLLNRLNDSVDNYMDFFYFEDMTTGEHYPFEIRYTGNTRTGMETYNTVGFYYETDPKQYYRYLGGRRIFNSKRIKKIVVRAQQQIIKQYKLEYVQEPFTDITKLKSVKACSAHDACLPKTLFNYTDQNIHASTSVQAAHTYLGASNSSQATNDANLIQYGDFNADGVLDIFKFNRNSSSNNTQVWLGNGDGSFQQNNPLSGPAFSLPSDADGRRLHLSRYQFLDVNADGFTDIYAIARLGTSENDKVYINNRSGGFNSPVNGIHNTISSSEEGSARDIARLKFGDFNGDGYIDIYKVRGYDQYPTTHSSNQDYYYLGNGNGTFAAGIGTGIFTQVNPDDDDGRARGDINDVNRILTADFNGDGMTDIYFVNSQRGTFQDVVYLANVNPVTNALSFNRINNTGIYTTKPDHERYMALMLSRIKFADFNGDGNTDVYVSSSSGDSTSVDRIYMSDGDGTFRPAVYTNIFTLSEDDWDDGSADFNRARFGDFNGDGLSDLYYIRGSNSSALDSIYISRGNGKFYSAISGPNTYFVNDDEHGTSLARIRIADFNGDGMDDVYYVLGSGNSQYDNLYMDYATRIALNRVTNGLGIDIDIEYQYLTEKTNPVYTKGTAANNGPFISDFQGPIQVVSRSLTDSGTLVNGQMQRNIFEYYYGEAEIHSQGRGLLGFGKQTVIDKSTSAYDSMVITNYHHDFPFIGQVSSSQTYVNNVIVSEEINQYSSSTTNLNAVDVLKGPIFPYVSSATSKSYEYSTSQQFTEVETNSIYDAYGNVTNVTVISKDGAGIEQGRTITSNQYGSTEEDLHFGRLTRTEVRKSVPGEADSIRKSQFSYYTTNDYRRNLLQKEIIQPGSDHSLIKLYYYDSLGNRERVRTQSGNGVPALQAIVTRDTKTEYAVQAPYFGRFPTKITNALNHIETREYLNLWGQVTKVTGPNGLSTTFDYDNLGRKLYEQRADGVQTFITYQFCEAQGGSCGQTLGETNSSGMPSYRMITSTEGAPDAIEYYDAVNRMVLSETQSFAGIPTFVETRYNVLGQQEWISHPYRGSQPLHITRNYYDETGRIEREMSPSTGDTRYEYNGFTVTVIANAQTPSLEQSSTEITNALDQTIQTIDAEGTTVVFDYNAAGNLISTTVNNDPDTTIVNTYNLLGYKESMTDPNMGAWYYEYNALGELVQQTDAKGQVTEMQYDVLGRMVSRTEDIAGASNRGTTTWVYDDTATSGAKALGKLSSELHYDGFTRIQKYDGLGRPSETITTPSTVAHTTKSFYDAYGRVQFIDYPTGFRVENVYNSRGYLASVRDANNTNTVYWQANTTDEFGGLTSVTLGNGLTTLRDYEDNSGRISTINTGSDTIQDLVYTYNPLGNLITRTDHQQNLTEDFEYDLLNRLTSAEVNGQTAQTYLYDALGNIDYKSDVGAYTYGKPNQVSSVSGVQNISYQYDANGNMTRRDGNVISWSSFNKPTIIRGEPGNSSTFAYGPDRARYNQITFKNSVRTQTLYIGGLYEKVIKGSDVRHKHFIRAGGQVVAIKTTGSENSTNYLHRDHLGSVDVITNTSGQVLERLSFDAFGQRRIATSWLAGLVNVVSNNTRGFTGHEQLDVTGLIHMNGRVYDPLIGRFLSADPFIQAPKNTQSFNRYSYVVNNPLNNTDPSGFIFKSISKAFKSVGKAIGSALQNPYVRLAVAIAVGYGVGKFALSVANASAGISAVTAKVIAGAAGGFAGGFVASGGDIKAAIVGGITGAAAGYIGGSELFGNVGDITAGRVVAHGVVGGASAEVQGGRFQQGFISSAFTKSVSGRIESIKLATNEVVAGIAAAVVGGTASVLSGGKFQNAALTSGFQYLYNEAASSRGAEQESSNVVDESEQITFTGRAGAFFAARTNFGIKGLKVSLDVDLISFHSGATSASNRLVTQGFGIKITHAASDFDFSLGFSRFSPNGGLTFSEFGYNADAFHVRASTFNEPSVFFGGGILGGGELNIPFSRMIPPAF